MRPLPCIVLCACASMLAGCSCEVTYADVSHHEEFRKVVGSRYEIIGEVDAYGIGRHSGAPADYLTLIPRPGIGGSEVVFEAPVPKGATVTVTKVFQTNRIVFESGITLEVELHGAGLPLRGRTLIDLNRGSEGPGPAGLNPEIYKKL